MIAMSTLSIIFVFNTKTIFKKRFIDHSLTGLHPKDQDVRNMIKEADTSKTGTIDFKGFVDCLTNKLMKMDNEDEILKAFNTFDRNDKGVIPADELRKQLTTLGDKLTEKEVSSLIIETSRSGVFNSFLSFFLLQIREVLKEGSDADGNFDYEKFVKIMTGKIQN